MIRKHVFFTEEQVRFLTGLDGLPFAEHIRRAIDAYIIEQKIKYHKASVSPSVK